MFAVQTGSKRIQKIHECVNRIKSSEEMGVKFMQSWEEKIIERQQDISVLKNWLKIAARAKDMEEFEKESGCLPKDTDLSEDI